MNKQAILKKIKRNLDMLQISATLDTASITVNGLTIACVDASIASPMGGIDGTVSPFLGIGVAAPGKISIKGAAGENTVVEIMTSELRLKVLSLCLAFANNVVILDGDTSAQVAEIPGHVDAIGVGS